jgi:PAS domain S-box-containing protein
MSELPDDSSAGEPAWALALRRRLALLEAENGRLATALSEAAPPRATRRDSEAWLRLAQDAGGICSWQWEVASGELQWSDNCHALHGMNPALPPDYETWFGGIHDSDRPAVEATLRGAMQGGAESWDSEFRYIRQDDGALRWLVGRGRIERDPASGAPLRLIGIGFDITERKESEARQTLLMRELDHRVRNLLAVVQATLRLTPKDDPEVYARAVEGRIAALARAHAMLAEARWSGSDLRALIAAELAPFLAAQRVTLDGPAVMLPARIAQPLAMAMHELATNAVKHGALLAAEGRIAIAWSLAEAAAWLDLRWSETGTQGVAPPVRRGFGSRMLAATVRGQLGGELAMEWAPDGLSCRLGVPLAEPQGL